jgi:hypothetical protein
MREITESGEVIDWKNKIRPYLGIFIILLIVISVYIFFVNITANKVKNAVLEYAKSYEYESIKISGFPFSKKITIKNMVFSSKSNFITKNKISIDELTLSNFIFGSNIKIQARNIKTINFVDNSVYTLVYNNEPEISISFYSDGKLDSFKYIDTGYKVLSIDNKTLYMADSSNLEIKSVKNGDTIDYAISVDFQGMQNFDILNDNSNPLDNVEPNGYNLLIDLSVSLTRNKKITTESTIKINKLSFSNKETSIIDLFGDIFFESGDKYSFGKLKLVISNYKNFMDSFKKSFKNALEISYQTSPVDNNTKKDYGKMIDSLFKITDALIKNNPESKEDIGVLELTRAKKATDYFINGKSIFDILKSLNE